MQSAVDRRLQSHSATSKAVAQGVLACGLAVVVFGSVLAFGATQPWSIYAFEVASAVLFAGAWTRMVLRWDFAAFRTPLMGPILLFAGIVALQVFGGYTAYAGATRAEALRYIAYFCIFVVACDAFRVREVARAFLNALILFGTLVAIEAILQDLSAPGLIYWRIPVPASGSVYGPFASHGLYAGFMELVAGVAIVKWLNIAPSHPRWLLWGFCTVLTSSSILLSRSRAGMLALFCEFLFAAVLALARSRRASKMPAVILATVIIAISAWLGSTVLLHRTATFFDPLNNAKNGDRLTIASDSLRMVRAKPLLGWGLDVFPVVYPKFRSFATDTFINEAHNDYLQVLVETGIAGAFAVALFMVSLYRSGLSRLRSRRRSSVDWVVAGALTACTGMFVHNAFDFNFHVTADAALFYVLAAMVTCARNPDSGTSAAPATRAIDLTENG